MSKNLVIVESPAKAKTIAAHLLGRCFVQEGWHGEAVGEFKEALAALDPDTLSPREAQEFLYRVKSLLETVAAAPDKLV